MLAVMTFFVISGFVVAEANAVFYRDRPLAFLANRFLRLAPPYFAALLLSVLVHALLVLSGRLSLWYYPSMANPLKLKCLAAGVLGLLPALNRIFPVANFEFIPYAWSLRYEMAFYLAVTATLLLTKICKWRPTITAALLLALIASVVSTMSARPGGLSQIPMFLCGVIFWLVLAKGGVVIWAVQGVVLVAAAAGFAAFGHDPDTSLITQLALLAALVGTFAKLAAWHDNVGWQALDRRLGDLSYPLYLNHYIVLLLAVNLSSSRSLHIFVGAAVVAVLLALVMAQLVDAPLRIWRDRVRGRAL